MSQGVYVLGGKCSGGKCQGGKFPGGICPWGKCPGSTCPGELHPRTIKKCFLTKTDFNTKGKFCRVGSRISAKIG